MNKAKKLIAVPCGILLILSMLLSLLGAPTASVTAYAAEGQTSLGESAYIKALDGISIDRSKFYSTEAVTKLPESIGMNDKLSLIVVTGEETLLDLYKATDRGVSFGEFAKTESAEAYREALLEKQYELLGRLDATEIVYDLGDVYDTLACGFEITLRAKYFEDAVELFGEDARVVISDTYNVAETELVENIVNVYETGIFNSSAFPYDGTGMVVAVLDTGLDYYHTAFGGFKVPESELGLTFEDVKTLMDSKDMAAERINPGLTASDVYISTKVPFAFDYADSDSDVYPLRSHHGTHVSGIIAGKDETITGVAPNAQLVEMKIFSDIQDTARSSWILSALEDCVHLGVDVINLSIGTSCGFSTPSEKEQLAGVYDHIRDLGISLIVAASNSFNSGYGSEKNGNLDLTSNPDSGTIGSPATYDGALAVGSVEGEKTAYLLYDGKIVYFNEATSRGGDEKDFVDELLGEEKFLEIEYVKIPGVGRSADYVGLDVTGKIVLVSRGSNTFEEKVNTAEKKGAAGIIIYNNVSGDILMNVGTTTIPACSISQDDGRVLAAAGSGVIRLAKNQAAGPFISDFSSWGPSPNLELKPEITAHGGSILSSVPGQDYDRISGTSMATPNVAGLAALLRQYIEKEYGITDPIEITEMINRLLMSTADIIYNKNGLAYSPRKQGAGLASLDKAAKTTAYILTYDRLDGSVMDKSKIELGDDPTRSGKYTLTFEIVNFGKTSLTYAIDAFAMTEGVSDTKTARGETTVTQDGYLLSGAAFEIVSVTGAEQSGASVTVGAGKTARVSISLTLTDENKKYLDESFENGMYVEGFVTLDAEGEDVVDLSVPYLAFYGDWTEAPLFDLDYFETNKDELDDGIDPDAKTLADAYATRPIGGLSGDYVGYLGSYYYEQEPGSDKIAADRKYISLSNQPESINSLRYVWAGLLRGAKKIDVTITEDSTGKVVYRTTDDYVRKSYSDGGPAIYPANVEIEFSAIEANLKNNTAYTVTLEGYLDYGDGGFETNSKNTFTFPFVTDFEAPSVTGCEFYTEYDRTAKKNRLFAKVAIYDNHYAMAGLVGYVGYDAAGTGAMFYNFDQYFQQIYSDFNSTTYFVYELTDYVDDIKSGALNKNTFTIMCYDYALNNSTFEIPLPDEYTDITFTDGDDTVMLTAGRGYTVNEIYAHIRNEDVKSVTSSDREAVSTEDGKITALKNSAEALVTVELNDGSRRTVWVTGTKATVDAPEVMKRIFLSPNETYKLTPAVEPNTEWSEVLVYTSTNNKVASVIGTEVLALAEGETVIRATAPDGRTARLSVTVLSEESAEKYGKRFTRYDKPVVQSFDISGYITNKAYYFLDSSDRDIGADGTVEGKDPDIRKFVGSLSLSMYPSEAVTLLLDYAAYFPEATEIVFESSNPSIVTVDEYGRVTARATGYASVTASVKLDGKSTYFSKTVSVDVKEPYVTNGPQLLNYFGNGGVVEIPKELCLTHIGQFAFSNYTYVEKGPMDEISEEMPEATKIWFIGDNTITKIIIPEGVEEIGMYAFANLTALEEVTLPSTLKSISNGAFFGCTSLTKVTGIENVKFINTEAFASCDLKGTIELGNAIAISDYAFANNRNLEAVKLSEHANSIASYAFANNSKLRELTIESDKIKLGEFAFNFCSELEAVRINAAVIPRGAFNECKKLKNVTIGKDVEVIGEYAFSGTAVESFTVEEGNATFFASNDGSCLLNKDGTEVLLVAPSATRIDLSGTAVNSIASGAFSGNTVITEVIAPSVTRLGDYAFAACTSLSSITLGDITEIGDYAFYRTAISTLPSLDGVDRIGDYAFAETRITEVTVNGTDIGEGAFSECKDLKVIKIGDGVTVGAYAFSYARERNYTDGRLPNPDSTNTNYHYYIYTCPVETLEIGKNVTIGEGAFFGLASVRSVELGEGAKIGDYAFYNTDRLESIDLSKVVSIGKYAFSGDVVYYFTDQDMTTPAINKAGTDYLYRYYSPNLRNIDLSSLTELGEGAFAYCGHSNDFDRDTDPRLTSVTLGEGAGVIPAYAFAYCTELSAINLDSVTDIGSYAFVKTKLSGEIMLSSIEYIGEYAFTYCEEIAKLTLGKSIREIAKGAFTSCKVLGEVAGLENARVIGDHSFAYTALTDIDLTAAEYIGSYAFIKENPERVTLTLGKSIREIGEDNPFAGCVIAPPSDGELGELVTVIGGGIYLKVPNGLVLVAYLGDDVSVKVADGTVRIAAAAFSGNKTLTNVILPYTLKSIGHKAFYGCDSLRLVTFTSYDAPILEEEYDIVYYMAGNLPFIYDGIDGGKHGLGIIDYFMWNADSSPSNVFYGASFKDYVGTITDKLVMTAPVNGKSYDSFIFGQYFDLLIDGAAAADDTTLEAIGAISRLPERVTLADKALVEAARAAYDKIATAEQQVLVTEYQKLVKAEKLIADYEYVAPDTPSEPEDPEIPSEPSTDTPAPTPVLPTEEKGGVSALLVVLIAVATLLLGTVGGAFGFYILTKKRYS